jgi:hypothetical protein
MHIERGTKNEGEGGKGGEEKNGVFLSAPSLGLNWEIL